MQGRNHGKMLAATSAMVGRIYPPWLVSENLGATAVASVAQVVTSLTCTGFPLIQFLIMKSFTTIHIVKPNASAQPNPTSFALGFTMCIVAKNFISVNCVSGNPNNY